MAEPNWNANQYYIMRTPSGSRLAARLYQLLYRASGDVGYDLLGRVTQGSYNSSVGASAGTHDRGGAVDLSVRGLTSSQKWDLLTALRRRGLVAWRRTTAQGNWPEHIHGIDRGAGDLSSGAKAQVSAWIMGRNGLANNGPDDGPKVPISPYVYTTQPQGGALVAVSDQEWARVAQMVEALRDAVFYKSSSLGTNVGLGVLIRDMPKTIWQDVKVQRYIGDKLVEIPVIQELADVKTESIGLRAQVTALELLVQSLLNEEDVDIEEIKEVVKQAVAAGLSEGEVTVTFTPEVDSGAPEQSETDYVMEQPQ